MGADTNRLLQRAARLVPVKNPVKRDPAGMEVVRKVAHDSELPTLLRSAVVIQYYMAGRGCNVYETAWSRKHPEKMLRWNDVSFHESGSQVEARICIRNEKNAMKHSGTFQPIVLGVIPQEGPAPPPCPVTALRAALAATPPPREQQLVFPGINVQAVTRALNKHAAPGQKHTGHSVRQGHASDLWNSGAPHEDVKNAGRWLSDRTPNVYKRRSAKKMAEQAVAIAAHVRGGPPVSPSHSPNRSVTATTTLEPGLVFLDPTRGVLMLMAPIWEALKWKWRAYYYDVTSQAPVCVDSKERCENEGITEAHWDYIHQEDMEYFHAHATRFMGRLKPTSQLFRDARTVRDAASDRRTDHNVMLPHRFPAPTPPIGTQERHTLRQQALHRVRQAATTSSPPGQKTYLPRPRRATRKPKKFSD